MFYQTGLMNRKKFNEFIIIVLKSAVLKLPSVQNFRIINDGACGCSVGKHGQVGRNYSLKDARERISNNSFPGQTMYSRSFQFLLQPSQSADLNTLDLGSW